MSQENKDVWHEAIIHECMMTETCYINTDPIQTIKNLVAWHIDNTEFLLHNENQSLLLRISELTQQLADAKLKESAAQRITEQDAREMILSHSYSFRFFDEWIKNEGRTLLAKLNKHREPVATANSDPVEIEVTPDSHAHIVSPWHTGLPRGRHFLQITANKAEMPDYNNAIKILRKAEREGNHIKCLNMITEAINSLPLLKNGT